MRNERLTGGADMPTRSCGECVLRVWGEQAMVDTVWHRKLQCNTNAYSVTLLRYLISSPHRRACQHRCRPCRACCAAPTPQRLSPSLFRVLLGLRTSSISTNQMRRRRLAAGGGAAVTCSLLLAAALLCPSEASGAREASSAISRQTSGAAFRCGWSACHQKISLAQPPTAGDGGYLLCSV